MAIFCVVRRSPKADAGAAFVALKELAEAVNASPVAQLAPMLPRDEPDAVASLKGPEALLLLRPPSGDSHSSYGAEH